MKRTWADEAIALIKRGEAVALITLTNVQGSAPRDARARMLVWAQGQFDTIGGGNLEMMLTRDARALLVGPDDSAEHDYPLGPILGQCCGGRVRAKIERLTDAHVAELRRQSEAERNNAPQLYLFGAGHVGEAIARAATPLPFALNWFDTRPEYATQAQLTDDPLASARNAPARAYYLVLTHNHDLDYELVRAILARRDAAYCGLIGSKSKRARFARQLRADGLGDELIRLTCPIGGSIGLKGKTPEIIAAATIAELLLVYEARVTTPEAAYVE